MGKPNSEVNSKSVKCDFIGCYKCCIETEMILTDDDLNRIENLGYDKNEFCLDPKETDGYWQLRNKKSILGNTCYFLSNQGKCTIYENRPQGCQIYPLIYDFEFEKPVIDEDCREAVYFNKQKYSQSQLITLEKLISNLFR